MPIARSIPIRSLSNCIFTGRPGKSSTVVIAAHRLRLPPLGPGFGLIFAFDTRSCLCCMNLDEAKPDFPRMFITPKMKAGRRWAGRRWRIIIVWDIGPANSWRQTRENCRPHQHPPTVFRPSRLSADETVLNSIF